MKLVEILARELKDWPVEDSFPICQAMKGVLYVSCVLQGNEDAETIWTEILLELAEDWDEAEVTRAQWEAERARIADIRSMELIHSGAAVIPSAFNPWVGVEREKEQTNAEADRDRQAQYEQELWDKVATDALSKAIGEVPGVEDLVSLSCNIADAFMAERAKRLKGAT